MRVPDAHDRALRAFFDRKHAEDLETMATSRQGNLAAQKETFNDLTSDTLAGELQQASNSRSLRPTRDLESP